MNLNENSFTRYRSSIVVQGSAARADYNPLTGNWLVGGQQGSYYPYIVSAGDPFEAQREAAALTLTVARFNETGEIVRFQPQDVRFHQIDNHTYFVN
jgi:hypothetical protein